MLDVTRITKLLPLLGSDNPGEVAATAAAITRTLQKENMDWHDLSGTIARGWAVVKHTATPPVLNEWQQIARACLAVNGGTLTAAQADFLRNMMGKHTVPTESRWRWLDAIAATLKVREAA